MLSKIQKKYQSYKDIYEKLLPILDGDKNSELAKTQLENSLYLSVFTTFESFLKELIANYIYNKEKKGIKFTELSVNIAHSIYLMREKRILQIFDDKHKKDSKSFKNHFDFLTKNIDKQTLESYIHFEFLHKDKINGYYKDLFLEILGDREFLHNLKLTQKIGDFGNLLNQEIQSNAATFLCEYADKIRNSIAHENEKFKIEDYTSFNDIVDTFYTIIEEISNKYEKNNEGFSLEDKIEINILDNI